MIDEQYQELYYLNVWEGNDGPMIQYLAYWYYAIVYYMKSSLLIYFFRTGRIALKMDLVTR